MKHLIAGLLLIYLLVLLGLAWLPPYTHVHPGPEIRAGARPELPVDAPDFRKIKPVEARKETFFAFMRPLVAYQNAFYGQERHRLRAIIAKLDAGQQLSRSDRRKLAYWSNKFHLDAELDLSAQIDLLQRRLHRIPEAMVLAQAATESAWGRSRFAREGNNYFGQWCYDVGCGLVPSKRGAKAKHEVRNFESALAAVRAYFININTHRAYQSLREKRLALEQNGEDISAHTLVGELENYSQRGQPYIKELRQIIRGNELE